MENKKEIAIIGAGFSGLTLAYDLVKEGYKVSIFEKDKDLGGLASTFSLSNGKELEKFYHHLFASDNEIIKLVKEIGLEDKIKLNESKTGIFCNGKIYSLSSPQDLLNFKELKFIDRIKMGLGVLRARLVKNYKKLEKTLASDWLIWACGKNAYETVWKSLLIGKFGEKTYKDISAVWIWNKFKLRGGSRNKQNKECLVYFDGGFGEILKTLKNKLEEKGVNFYFESNVEKIEKKDDGFVLKLDVEEKFFPKIAFTGSTKEFLNVVDFLPTDYKERIEHIKYLANICLVFEMNEKFSDIYWLNIADSSFPFVGIIEHTNFDDIKNYGGKHILYLSKYLLEEEKLYSMSKEELVDFCIPYLQKINKNFTKENITKSYLFSARYSQPVIEREYSKYLFDMKTGVDGLYFTCMAQIYPQDRGTNYAVEYARKLSKVIINDVKKG